MIATGCPKTLALKSQLGNREPGRTLRLQFMQHHRMPATEHAQIHTGPHSRTQDKFSASTRNCATSAQEATTAIAKPAGSTQQTAAKAGGQTLQFFAMETRTRDTRSARTSTSHHNPNITATAQNVSTAMYVLWGVRPGRYEHCSAGRSITNKGQTVLTCAAVRQSTS
jgi:hypothetical protein